MGPRAGPDAVAKRNITCPCLESNPGRPARTEIIFCWQQCLQCGCLWLNANHSVTAFCTKLDGTAVPIVIILHKVDS
jgi:hypothetical protein